MIEAILTFNDEAIKPLEEMGHEAITRNLVDPTLIDYSFWIENDCLDEFLNLEWLLECLGIQSLLEFLVCVDFKEET